jgi:hypothetical protein
MRSRRGLLTLLTACSVLAVAGVPGVAQAGTRDCGRYATFDDGTYATTDASGAASCAFAEVAADRFWGVDGVPRRLRVGSTRLSYTGHRSGAHWEFWFYSGSRRGRYAGVFFTQWDPPATSSYVPSPRAPSIPASPPSPTISYPGRGYPVTCADGSLSHSGGIQGACSYHGGIG